MRLEEPGDLLRRILKVSVDQKDDITAGVLQGGGQRSLMPEVAREPDGDDPGVDSGRLLDEGSGTIRATIGDHYDLVWPSRHPIEHGGYPANQLGDRFLFVEERDRNRHTRIAHARLAPLK